MSLQSNTDEECASARRMALSRRDVLVGVAATALAAAAPAAMASAVMKKSRKSPAASDGWDLGLKRYMAAAVAMADGRLMITGGYNQPWTGKSAPQPLQSAVIVSPGSGRWTAAAPMNLARARHAAIALPDGRVAVLGGMSHTATASIEIYDPQTDTWEIDEPLAQARYDHSAVFDGSHIYVMGGSSSSMMSGVEVFHVNGSYGASPRP